MAPKKVKLRKTLVRNPPKKDLTKLMDHVIADQQAARARADWRRGTLVDNARLRAWANEHMMRQPNLWRNAILPTVRKHLKPFISEAQLAGPGGTRRIPQFDELAPIVKAQARPPLVALCSEPLERWNLSPYVWGLQNMAENLEATAAARADEGMLENMLAEQARRFDVQRGLLRDLLKQKKS